MSDPTKMTTKNVTALAATCILFASFAEAGDYGAAIDAQSDVMRQTLSDSATLQSMARDNWNRLSDRERFLITKATDFADSYYEKFRRYPSTDDTELLRWLNQELRVTSQPEAQIVYDVLAKKVEHQQSRDDTCRRMQGYDFEARVLEIFCD